MYVKTNMPIVRRRNETKVVHFQIVKAKTDLTNTQKHMKVHRPTPPTSTIMQWSTILMCIYNKSTIPKGQCMSPNQQ